MSGRLFVVSGPSGVGKGTLIARARAEVPRLELATSATTRPMRPSEQQGREYHFLSPDEFQRRLQKGEFLEHVEFAGHRYGTLRSEVERRLADGSNVISRSTSPALVRSSGSCRTRCWCSSHRRMWETSSSA